MTTGYLKDPSSPTYANDAQVKLYQRLMAKYAPGQPASDGLFFYGMAKADTFIQALYRSGRNPTRQSVMNAAANLKWKSPWLLPGSTINTSPGSAFPIRYQKLSRYQNNAFIEFGNLVKTR